MLSSEELLNLFKDDVKDLASMVGNKFKEADISPSDVRQIELPQNVATKYGNYFVSILNQQSAPAVRRFFEEDCTPTTRITLKVRSFRNGLENFQHVLNHFGTFASADLSMDEFILMLSAYWEIAPDEFMELLSSRCCCRGESTVYISCFRSIGTIITRDSLIGVGDKDGHLCEIRFPRSDILLRSVMERFSQSFIAEGSFALYRNQDGRIHCIEFYYEFIV